MELCNDRYTISIELEDPKRMHLYDIVYNPKNILPSLDICTPKAFHIRKHDGSTINILLLDTTVADCEYCSVLAENLLTAIMFDAIVQIDLLTGAMLRYVECDNIGGLFEIHQICNGYILHGEGEIFRYDLELNQLWQFSGRDIFVSYTGEKAFWIDNEYIHCRDWLNWHYILDFDGNLVSETHISETL